MKKLSVIIPVSFILILCFLPGYFYAQWQNFNLSYGSIKTVESKVLNESREVFIYTPFHYNTTSDRFPVLYVLDGESNFYITVSTLEFLARNSRMPEMIVVGIPNKDRNRDFTPVKLPERPTSGGGNKFLTFMKDELFPFMENNYRTTSFRMLEGHSLCGMFVFYTMFNQPGMFNAFIAISPYLQYNNGYLFSVASSFLDKNPSFKSRIYYSAGALEGTDFKSAIDTMSDILKTKAAGDFDWKYELIANTDHSTVVPPTIYNGLTYLFRNWFIPNSVIDSGLASILKHYKETSSELGLDDKIPEALLNAAGYRLLLNNATDKAIEVFKKNVELHPASANPYDSLGEALEKANQIQPAFESYSKAYKIAQEANDPNLAIFKANYERLSQMVKAK